MTPLLINMGGIVVYGFRGYLCLPDMAGDVWPLPDPDEAIHL